MWQMGGTMQKCEPLLDLMLLMDQTVEYLEEFFWNVMITAYSWKTFINW